MITILESPSVSLQTRGKEKKERQFFIFIVTCELEETAVGKTSHILRPDKLIGTVK